MRPQRIARLMRAAGLVGISHRRKRGRHRPDTATHDDLVKRRFVADTSDYETLHNTAAPAA